MFITPIQPMDFSAIQPIQSVTDKINEAVSDTSAGNVSPFQDMLQNALNSMIDTDQQASANTAALASGSIDDLHTLGIENTKAYLAERMVIEIRNRALDAYSEIMRINL